MSFTFSQKQIDRAHILITEKKLNVNQIADEMNTTIRQAWHLIKQAKQKYPADIVDRKTLYDEYLKSSAKDKRPKAEYSNKSFDI